MPGGNNVRSSLEEVKGCVKSSRTGKMAGTSPLTAGVEHALAIYPTRLLVELDLLFWLADS